MMEDSENQRLLTTINRRDIFTRAIIIFFLLAGLIFNAYSLFTAQQETRKARQANITRQDNIINHIDCILLLTKKYPNVDFQALSYAQSKTYVVDCAKAE